MRFAPGDALRCVDASKVGKRKCPLPKDVRLIVARVTDQGRFVGIEGFTGYWNAGRFEAWQDG